ncbi:MAG TPA: hypothetical protein VIU61_01210, partial [Kofleriaceae bacterium]
MNTTWTMATVAVLAVAACDSTKAPAPGSGDISITRRDAQQTSTGPAENFTGTVKVQRLFLPASPSKMQGAYVSFDPGA